jgi:hypothetical protein
MRSMAQFCIKDLHDATPSETAPENPITGQIWIDVSSSPPVAKVWNGTEWEAQNESAKLREAVELLILKNTEFRERIAELDAYSGAENDSICALNDRMELIERYVQELAELVAANDVSGVEREVTAIRGTGMNEIANSSGLNGLSGWETFGGVDIDRSIETRLNTSSGACFMLGERMQLLKRVTGLVTDAPYALAFRIKRTANASFVASLVTGGNIVHRIDSMKANIWTTVEYVFDCAPDGTIEINIEGIAGDVFVGDFVLTLGNRPRAWTPHPLETYTDCRRIDDTGITLNSGNERSVSITHSRISVASGSAEGFAADAAGMRTKNAAVSGTVMHGKLMVMPCDPASGGADIYLLD